MSITRKTINRARPNRRSASRFRFLVCVLAPGALAPLALAAENPGAHEHGQAVLQMALENNRIDLMFTSPAYNLDGFEYEARTEEERKQLADTSHWLRTTPLINTDSGACSVATASVRLGGDQKHHHDKHSHNGHHHNDGHEGHSTDEATHRDYEVSQQLACAGTGGDATLTTPLPARFPELEALTIEWVGPNGQGSTVMTPESRSFSLSR